MPNYIIAYRGGRTPENPEEGTRQMARWQEWVENLGEAAINPGQPLKGTRIVSSQGTTDDGGDNPMSGYSIVSASTMEEALEMARACPFLDMDGTLEVAELVNMQAKN